jgi:hypothetical protein
MADNIKKFPEKEKGKEFVWAGFYLGIKPVEGTTQRPWMKSRHSPLKSWKTYPYKVYALF